VADNEIEVIVSSQDRTARGLDEARNRLLRFDSATGQFTEIDVTVNNDTDRGLDAARRDIRRLVDDADRLTRDLADSTHRNLRRGLADGTDQAAHDAARHIQAFVGNTSVSITNLITNIGGSTAAAGASGGAMTAASGGANLLAGALSFVATAAAVVTTGVLVMGPALLAAGGAMGALTTAAAGGGVAIATVGLGFHGVSDALSAAFEPAAKKAGGAMGNTAGAARSLAAAQRGLADAQAAVTQAWIDGARSLRDLNQQLAGAHLDEESAVLSVAEAERSLNKIRKERKADPLDIKRAELNYRQAQEALVETRTHLADLTEDADKSNKAGVAGSKQVLSAYDRQRAAMDSLKSAQESMAQASKGAAGGVDKLAEAMGHLAPNARLFVEAIIGLKPAFGALQNLVQNRLFAGMGESLRDLASKWLPALGPMLGGMADHLNNVGRMFFKAFGSPTFIANMGKAAEGFGRFLERIGGALARLVDAFGRLAGGSTPVLEKLGDLIAGLLDDFTTWVQRIDESGDLGRFMDDAARAIQNLWDIAGEAFGIVGDLVGILFPGSRANSEDFLGGVKGMLEQTREGTRAFAEIVKRISEEIQQVASNSTVKKTWEGLSNFITETLVPAFKSFWRWLQEKIIPVLKDIGQKYIVDVKEILGKLGDKIHENREAFQRWWDIFQAITEWIVENVFPVISEFYTNYLRQLFAAIGRVIDAFGWWMGVLGGIPGVISDVRGFIEGLVGFVQALPGRVRSAASGMWDGIKDAFKGAINWIIDRWNGLSLTIGGGSVMGVDIPSVRLDTPDIPHLARGGIGGGLTMLAERGRELVNLPYGSTVTPHGTTEAMLAGNGGNGGQITVVYDSRGAADELKALLCKWVRLDGQGSVQKAFGRSGLE
jgi:phage-related protein